MTTVGFGFEGIALQLGDALGRLEGKLQPATVIQYFAELGTAFPAQLVSNPDVLAALSSARTATGAAGQASSSLRTAIDGGSPSAVVVGLVLLSQVSRLQQSTRWRRSVTP